VEEHPQSTVDGPAEVEVEASDGPVGMPNLVLSSSGTLNGPRAGIVVDALHQWNSSPSWYPLHCQRGPVPTRW
jgi:hypothetical protein